MQLAKSCMFFYVYYKKLQKVIIYSMDMCIFAARK